MVPPVVVGVPVEDASTENMVPVTTIVRGSRLHNTFSRVNERMDSRGGQRTSLVVNFIGGILLPTYALIVYVRYGDRPCDKPIAGWLHTYALAGFCFGGLALHLNMKRLSVSTSLESASDDEGERQRVVEHNAPNIAQIACLSCCVLFPLGIFNFFWWVKGNFDVWGTFPKNDITPDEPWSTFSGCDPSLLGGARLVFLICYVLIACSIGALCILLVTIAAALDGAQVGGTMRSDGRAAMV